MTRASILELAANECGMTTRQEKLTIADLRKASEAFCCGTGACITPVGGISVVSNSSSTYSPEEDIVFGDGTNPGPITEKLYHMLTGIQTGSNKELTEKYKEWIHIVEPK